ncbi:MAG: hypothetical protein ABL982_23725 [Vicinamibacterales bacterium]
MGDRPAADLMRVLAGVLLMRGRLGHQTLGQLLLADSSDVAVAGASVVVAAASRSRHEVVRTVLGTAAPVLAVHALFHQRLARVEAREARIAARESEWRARAATLERTIGSVRAANQRMMDERSALQARVQELEAGSAGPARTPSRSGGGTRRRIGTPRRR